MSAPSAPLTGENVEPVREALAALKDGSGDYEAVRAAVENARFAPVPTARNVNELADNWEYAPVEDSFRDTVTVARWRKIITPEQERELRKIARHTGPDPSRLPQSPRET